MLCLTKASYSLNGLSDFIQVGEPIQNEDGLTFVGKLDECGDTFCLIARKLVKMGL